MATNVATFVLFLTLGITLWGGFMAGPRRLIPCLFLLGPLFLPAFARFDLPGLPALDRTTAVAAPALLLFLFCSRQAWRGFRVAWPDALLLAYVAWTVVCVVVNQNGYAAASMGLKNTLAIAVPYFAGRLYLQRTGDVVALARVIVPVVIVYLFLMAFEARMYPRFQKWVYGEDVIGLYRMGIYRPIVFAQNQLELGHMLVLLTLILLGVRLAGPEVRERAGRLLDLGIAAGCIGVLLSLSRGPIVGLLLALAVPFALRRQAVFSCLLGAAGVGFFLWMMRPGVDSLSAGMAVADAQTETGQTLFFRFLQIDTWKPMVEQSPIFGYGEEFERGQWDIIDGDLLLASLHSGYVGALLQAAFWLSTAWLIGRATFPRKNVFHCVGAALAPVVGWLVFTAWGDAFLRAPHYLILGGVTGVLATVRRGAEDDARAANPMRTVTLRYG